MARKKAPAEVTSTSIIDDLNKYSPPFDTGEQDKKPDNKDDQIAALQKQLTDLSGNMQKMQTDFMTVISGPIVKPVMVPQRPGQISYEGLPDPMDEPVKHAEALSARIRAQINAETAWENETAAAEAAQQAELEGKYEGLWQGFSNRYPEIAKNTTIIESVARKVVADASSRGIDTAAYMFRNSDQFYKDVAKEYDATLESLGVNRDDREENDGGFPEGRAEVFGGSVTGKGKGPSKAEAGDMILDLQELQRKDGFY